MTLTVSEAQLPVSPVRCQPTVDDQPAYDQPVDDQPTVDDQPAYDQPTVDGQPADAPPQLQSASAMSTEAYVLNIQQQPDGTCIISLPDDFMGEALSLIHI